MARERGAVPGIVGSVVHRLDVREAGEIHQARAQDRRTDCGGQALAQGRGAAGGVRSAADDRHGASLSGVWVKRAHENPASQARRVLNSARPPRVCYLIFSGRSPDLRGALCLISIAFPCRRGTVDLTLHSLTVAGAAPDLPCVMAHRFPVSPCEGHPKQGV